VSLRNLVLCLVLRPYSAGFGVLTALAALLLCTDESDMSEVMVFMDELRSLAPPPSPPMPASLADSLAGAVVSRPLAPHNVAPAVGLSPASEV
jgi:hypothetical protein